VVGTEACRAYADAKRMLRLIESWLTANGVIGLYPANSVG
jgi:5-methyltetrahydrofolate--homocysteine methyltransferase